MKRIGLFLLALVMVAGLAGCGGGADDFSPNAANMAGTYDLTKVTWTDGVGTLTMRPPQVSGVLHLFADGTVNTTISILGETYPDDTGTFIVAEDTIVIKWKDGTQDTGSISDGGRVITFAFSEEGETMTLVFTRS